MIITDKKELANLIISGKQLRHILDEIAKEIKPGVKKSYLNEIAEDILKTHYKDSKAAFLNYKPEGAKRAFPAIVCVSINNELVHGIPNENDYILQDGDVVKIDAGVNYKGMYSDAAFTKVAGKSNEKLDNLLNATKLALKEAISVAKAGATTGDIGNMVEKIAQKHHFSIAMELGGHGLGKVPHEDPFIPNFGVPGTGDVLHENMVIAIEPILIAGPSGSIKLGKDKFTYETRDGSVGAHFEHTIIVTKDKPIYITGEMWQ